MMLSQSSPPLWKQILRQNFSDIQLLADYLELSEEQRSVLNRQPRFSVSLPLRLAAKIRKGDLEDPIFKQFVSTNSENIYSSDFVKDPVGDNPSRKAPKLLHKYHGRMLLVCTSACAMHCRYCFRQHFDYSTSDKLFESELKYIVEDPTINEVILSGGDPLSLDDKVLENLLMNLASIPHVRKVRFHTRFPIGIPERINEAFIALLRKIPLQFWFVLHSNHAREFDADIFKAIGTLQKEGISILNTSVLLRGVNDDIDVLTELSNSLVDHGIMPYYLHQLDRVQGASHFEVPESRGIELIKELESRLPGYAVPKFVKEVAGMPSKVLLM